MRGFDPTQVPTVPVEVDWGHALAQGLLALIIPGIGPVDLVTGLPWTPRNNPQLAGCSYGTGLYLPANGSGATQPDYHSQPLQSWQQPTNVGVFCVGYFENIGENNYPSLFGAYDIVQIQTGGNPTVNFGVSGLGSNSVAIQQNAPIATAVVGFSGPSGTGLIVAGVGSGGTYGGTPTYSSTTYLYLGSGTASNGAVLVSGGFFNADYPQLPNAADWLQAEPFAMLRPLIRRKYYLPQTTSIININS